MRVKNSIFSLAVLIFSIQIFSVAAFAGQGVLDKTFGINGVKDTTFANPTFIGDTVVSGNKIWFTGIASFAPRNHVIYGRYSLDGTLDFSNIVRPCREDPNNPEDSTSTANKISLQTDGKLLVTGKCGVFNAGNFSNPFVFRINTNGTLDSSFGIGGIALLDLRTVPACGTNQTAYDIAVAPDGNIIVVGGDGVIPVSSGGCPGAIPAAIMLKISPTGSLLTPTYFPRPTGNFRFQSLTIQTDGKILVGYNDDGATAGAYQILRYNSDFTPDTSFGTNGSATFPIGTADPRGYVTSIHVESSGKIVVIGYIAPNNAQPSIARFLPNGTLDTTFNGTGRLKFPDDQNVNLLVNKIIRQPDGKYLISGAISQGWGGYRVNPNGTLDSTFGNRTAPGIAWFNPPTGNSTSVPAILPDGSMIQFGYANGGNNTIVRLVKINQNQNRNANLFDFDGDAKTDISIFRPSVGQWFYLRSSNSTVYGATFGSSTDKPVPADYTGDGKTDLAFFVPSSGLWFVLRSEDSSFYAFPFGSLGDIAIPADYDGDGKADAAVFRPSNGVWYISRSTGGVTIQPFGLSSDKPAVADYDGDGKSDIAIFRPSVGEWYYLRSSDSQVRGAQFGSLTDKPVQGDYTGDGKADFAFFRPSSGQWFVLRSEDSSFFASPFGVSTDTPTPGDYDGDGKFDQAVFRTSNGVWYVNRTTAGVQIQQFGVGTDLPVPAAFVP